MAVPVSMPTFGMTEGQATIVRWLKAVGDSVKTDEPLLEAETEKATVEVPSPVDGVLLRTQGVAGQMVTIKDVIGWIGQPGEQTTGSVGEDLSHSSSQHEKTESQLVAPRTSLLPILEDRWVKASPLARRIARQHNIDLNTVRGSGPGERVVEEDVRRRTAERMTQSFKTAPYFYLQMEVRAAKLVALRQELLPEIEKQLSIRLSYTDLFLRALAILLPKHPLLNANWQDDGVGIFTNVNLGVAEATSQGLLIPVLRCAESLSFTQLIRERDRLARQAQANKLTAQELTGGTFTLTNLGKFGIDSFIPIVNLPQSAILGVGAIADRPVGENGQLTLQPTVNLTLAVDHRVADGAQAAEFLREFSKLLESPLQLLL